MRARRFPPSSLAVYFSVHLHGPVPPPRNAIDMEFLNFLIILVAAWLVWRRPERERLAFGLVVVSCVIMAVLFFIGTHTSVIPGVNL